MVQWTNAGVPGSIPGQGTRSHVPQVRVCMQQLKIPHATSKTQLCQNNSNNKKKNMNELFKLSEMFTFSFFYSYFHGFSFRFIP